MRAMQVESMKKEVLAEQGVARGVVMVGTVGTAVKLGRTVELGRTVKLAATLMTASKHLQRPAQVLSMCSCQERPRRAWCTITTRQ